MKTIITDKEKLNSNYTNLINKLNSVLELEFISLEIKENEDTILTVQNNNINELMYSKLISLIESFWDINFNIDFKIERNKNIFKINFFN